jgi:hypothetical protein
MSENSDSATDAEKCVQIPERRQRTSWPLMKHKKAVKKQLMRVDFRVQRSEKTSPGEIGRLVFSSHLRYAWGIVPI